MINNYPPSCNLWIGDLVYLEQEKRIGIVIKISHDQRYELPATNAYILWGNNKKSWCLGEALTVLSKAKKI